MKRQLKAGAAQGAAIRFVPYKARRNSFAGLVGFPRRVAGREDEAARGATGKPTMPGSVRQSTDLVRRKPNRSGLSRWRTWGDGEANDARLSQTVDGPCKAQTESLGLEQVPDERRRGNQRCLAQSDSRRPL